MVRRFFMLMCTTCICLFASEAARAQAQPGSIEAWGQNAAGQCDVPVTDADFVAVACGWFHSIGLKSDGTVVAWGYDVQGQCDVPEPNADFVGVAGGYYHSLGVRGDGTVVSWGDTGWGQCDVPEPNADFVAVAAGGYHSVGVKSDGSIVAWGRNDEHQCDVPSDSSGYVGAAAGVLYTLGLTSDGRILAWGDTTHGQCDVVAPNEGFTAVAAGGYHAMGLRSNGAIAAWGYNDQGACTVPPPNADFVAIAGGSHSLGVKSDGAIVSWGNNAYGQLDVPLPNEDFAAVAAGSWHSLGIRSSDTPVETVFYATLVEADCAVLLRWSLPSCSSCVGLLVYRGLSEEGPYECLTPEPVLDAGSGGSYVDETVWPGGTFWYELRTFRASGEDVLATDIHPSIAVPGALMPAIRYVRPNPATVGASIGYSLPERWQSARLSVHDVAGRLVRRLDPTTGAQGHVAVDWDGTASSGERVSSGVYFFRLEVDGAVATERIVLVR
jgi:hypothetical protein